MSTTDAPFLRYTDETGHAREVTLSIDSPRVTVGRSSDADVSLADDPEVSRLHATLEWIGTDWTIVDDGLSRNGTFVNGERISGRRRLRNGDSIRIGNSAFVFRDLARQGGEPTRVAADIPTIRSLTRTQREILIALCRPYKHNAAFANPASNQQVADEVFLSVDAVKTHLRALFAKFGVENLPQNQKRLRLVEKALHSGVITEHDL
ncbi:FHA domain-containing protein [Prescottella equi]|uniref:FHA domain-containing protein n=1 Tax=Rhodococcus hoagii TaxID=43767 RepID=A0AAE5CGQ9_RHOHA|nr:FHA domain-containing protein [Prescottella equi]NKS28884.1 FHA domain-containing protein [Prescottella equi]NKS84578.1 FHA domain-containing protein [Prescottella equi]NKT15486.1 FHA domain-containing protein [Prescottella equi]NKW47418.1 FHA domain-containing protein [Prescottella equi]ORL37038.1 LuxR family transcriptional regulator [Prescottella equi]